MNDITKNSILPEVDNFKSGYVSIIGNPNVGKSTLLNSLMGMKLAIVTPKPQTTRNRITGILTTDNYQIIFIDTPGVLEPKYKLQERMVKTAFLATDDADLILYMLDATNVDTELEKRILVHLSESNAKTFLLINKIDLVDKRSLLPLIDMYKDKFDFEEIHPISALQGDGLSELIGLIVQYLPQGPIYYPPDQVSESNERFFVAEIIREKVFLRTKQEIPYASSVLIEQFKERDKGKTYIQATIFVERDSQKGILIGKRGRSIKTIGQDARREIEEFIGNPVYLDLRVAVKENWSDNERELKELGYF